MDVDSDQSKQTKTDGPRKKRIARGTGFSILPYKEKEYRHTKMCCVLCDASVPPKEEAAKIETL